MAMKIPTTNAWHHGYVPGTDNHLILALLLGQNE